MSPGCEPTLQDAKDAIVRQALHISRLELDNATLRNELAALRQSQTNHDAPKSGDGRSTSPVESRRTMSSQGETTSRVSTTAYDKLAQEHADLKSLFATIESEHATCAARFEKLERDLRKAKEYCQAWKKYVEQQMKKRSASDHVGTSSAQGNSSRTPRAVRSSEATVADDHVSVSSEHLPNFAQLSSAREPLHRVSSSQTTVYEPDEHNATPQAGTLECTDDQPEVVFVRPVKRKGAADSGSRRVKVKKEPESPSGVIELSSGPLECPQRTPEHSNILDLSDLDAVGPPIITPRIDRRARDKTIRASSEGVERAAPRLCRTSSSLSDSAAVHPESAEIMRDSRPNDGTPGTPLVLQPLSVNIPTKTPVVAATKGKQTRPRRARANDKVALLSEDGDDRASQNTPRGQRPLHGGKPADLRLEGLLNEHLPEKTPTFTRHSLHASAAKAKASASPALPTPASIVKRMSPAKRVNPNRHQNMPAEPAPAIRPDDEPLRARNLATLQLDDFKINPKYMGTDFAFADPIRAREQRKKIHTCTRADCCGGALAKVIAVGGQALTGKTDAQALEAYLGPDFEYHMADYGADEKKKTTAQAHVFCLGNQYGRHRQAFARARTPPGFWNTDFPTTQETAQNRAKAQEQEREEVAERWRDALRGNGRWMFKDE